jgi:hypothetical protein
MACSQGNAGTDSGVRYEFWVATSTSPFSATKTHEYVLKIVTEGAVIGPYKYPGTSVDKITHPVKPSSGEPGRVVVVETSWTMGDSPTKWLGFARASAMA